MKKLLRKKKLRSISNGKEERVRQAVFAGRRSGKSWAIMAEELIRSGNLAGASKTFAKEIYDVPKIDSVMDKIIAGLED